MRPTPFYFFEYLPAGAKKSKRTTYRMTIEDATQRLPGAVPIESTKEIRNLPEGNEWLGPGQHSRYMTPPPGVTPGPAAAQDLPAGAVPAAPDTPK